ncbi:MULTISPECIES: sn-glycerol-1-phosphate dehydrogenase [unclassified Paenibacillus]|uniref:sn-glycerol-1-phosphate dehydrogenase n=1 Tax=unclassified Paenibacillus TaxID=185978 RepID=UPI001C117F91|nr:MULTISPECIES: sn-glycerol-1-phosphate dehydrogenase [unclassified Paenibacillus]MBU5442833.1 sn-glycerol-1-phosphate dehydrogenase [Paenibacillus sp. MSJ-34]CAH0119258.1 Glycerol-1-phosphate dehydrogenase [NAD(P)+] [Paenibacillus sp. CECT 9249]
MNTIEQHPFERLVLAPGATKEIVSYFHERGIARTVLVGDRNTYEAAGEAIERTLREAGAQVGLCLVTPGDAGDVVADEASIVQLLLEIEPGRTDMLIAAGAGTIHDIVRFAGFTTGTPFVSVPTAPSVDGFTSAGAPLIVRGVKKTVQATAPVAIFADTDILAKAPQPLIAAGFGDMIGKYTSLFDWKFSHLAAGEPYDESVASMTERALASCVEHVREIGERTERGIRVLMAALIESGIAMLRFGRSHPASGAEHHLSHYWEMEYLRRGNRALLHGAKVGAACAEISRMYHEAAERGIYPGRQPEELRRYGGQIREWLAAVPRESQIRELLSQAGGPTDRAELGIDDELFARSLREAHRLRDRYTLLRALNEA